MIKYPKNQENHGFTPLSLNLWKQICQTCTGDTYNAIALRLLVSCSDFLHVIESPELVVAPVGITVESRCVKLIKTSGFMLDVAIHIKCMQKSVQCSWH